MYKLTCLRQIIIWLGKPICLPGFTELNAIKLVTLVTLLIVVPLVSVNRLLASWFRLQVLEVVTELRFILLIIPIFAVLGWLVTEVFMFYTVPHGVLERFLTDVVALVDCVVDGNGGDDLRLPLLYLHDRSSTSVFLLRDGLIGRTSCLLLHLLLSNALHVYVEHLVIFLWWLFDRLLLLLFILYFEVILLAGSRFGVWVWGYDVDFLVIDAEDTALHPLFRFILSTNLLGIYNISLNNRFLFRLGYLCQDHVLSRLLLLLDSGVRLNYLGSFDCVDATCVLLHAQTLFGWLLSTETHHLFAIDVGLLRILSAFGLNKYLILALGFINIDVCLGIREENGGLMTVQVGTVISQIWAAHHLVVHVVGVERLILLANELELVDLLIEGWLLGIDLSFDEGTLLGTSHNCCSGNLIVELLFLDGLFGNLRHNLLPSLINILLLLSNQGMPRLSTWPFSAIGVVFGVGRVWEVKIILMAQVNIILLYLINGLVRILHVLRGRTLNDRTSLGWNNRSSVGTEVRIMHIFEVVDLLNIYTLFEYTQSGPTILVSVWWHSGACQLTGKVRVWVQDLRGLISLGLASERKNFLRAIVLVLLTLVDDLVFG